MDAEQIKQIVVEAVAEATNVLKEQHEVELQKLRDNRDQILREKKKLEGKDQDLRNLSHAQAMNLSTEDFRRYLDQKYPGSKFADAVLPSNTDFNDHKPAEVVIKKGISHAEYVAAKELAAKEGVPFRVEGDEPTPALVRNSDGSPVKKIETDTHVYVNNELRRKLGVQGALQLAGSKQLVVFRSPDELPAEAQAKHRAILEARDPDDLIFDEGDGQ